MKMLFCAALSVAAVSFLGAAQEAYTLAWNPAAGSKSKLEIQMTSDLDFGQGPMPLVATLTIENEVKEVKEDQFTMVSAMTKHQLLVADQDVSTMMPGSELFSAPVTRTYSKKGLLVNSDSKSALDNPRFEQLRVVAFPDNPVKIGESWTNDFKGNKDRKVPPSRAKFTLEGIEKVGGLDAFRISFSFSELEGSKPMGAIGTAWLDKATGDLVKTDADINDAQFVEEMPPMHFKMKIRRL